MKQMHGLLLLQVFNRTSALSVPAGVSDSIEIGVTNAIQFFTKFL